MLSVFDQGPPAPCPEPFNMAAYVLQAGQSTADKIALEVVGGEQPQIWTYRDLRTAVLGLAFGLRDAGLLSGDKVLMRLGNDVSFPVAYLACIAAGLIPIPTSAQLTIKDVDKIMAELSPAAVLYADGISLPQTTSVPFFDVAWQKAQYSGAQLSPELGDPDRLAYIVYTSGTGGHPRAVGHAHRAVWARRMMWQGWYGLHPSDRLLHAGAFNWTYTLGTGLVDPWAVGATALVCADGTDHAALPQLIHQHDVSIFAAAPAVYRRMLRDSGPWQTSHLRHGLSAGEKMSETLKQAWQHTTTTPVLEAYGMTECSTFISAKPDSPDSLCPQSGRRVAIVDADGQPVPHGTIGTIAIDRADAGFMLGYINAPDELQTRLRGDWFLTGDQGRMDKNGHVGYVGRDDDMMNAGGIRVSPLEVEAAMSTHPDLTECGAVALEVKDGVEVIALFYTGPASAQSLQEHADVHLAAYKRPRLYIAKDVLPKGANNKLLRGVLRNHRKEPHNGET